MTKMADRPARCFARLVLLVVSMIAVASATAAAQQSIASQQLHRGIVERDTPWLALLREAYAQGSQEKIVSVITEFLADLPKGGVRECCDQNRYVFQVVFFASEASDAPLVRVLVHKNGLARGSLPGIEGILDPLFEVFVAEDLSVRLSSVYQSTPLENPLAAQSGEFVRLVLTKLALPLGSNLLVERALSKMTSLPDHQRERLKKETSPLAVTLSKVVLPTKRAQITISNTITFTDPVRHAHTQSVFINDSVKRFSVINFALDRPTLPDTACASVSEAILAAITKATTSDMCTPVAADPSECFKTTRASIAAAHRAAMIAQAGCSTETAFPLVRRYTAIFPEKYSPTPITPSTLANTPETHLTFGLSTAFIGHLWFDHDKPRTKINNGKIVVDPFSRLLAMGTVSWTPAGYDPSSVLMTTRERVKLFGGVAFAPHFGGTGGASWAFNRYLGVNVGYAYLIYDTPKSGEILDAAPSQAAPFELAGAHAWFLGLAYTIGK